MHQTTLNDAALAISRILTLHRIHHGFFGGFAILAKGARHRESKDLDVLVSATKAKITSILTPKRGFLEIPHLREDYVAYFWDSSEFCEGMTEMVLVEIFLGHSERFPVSTKNHVLRGASMGTSYVPVLAEEFLFRGKMCAAAMRAKAGDVQDIQYLINTCSKQLKRLGPGLGLDKEVVELAVKRYPQLRKMLEKIGVETRGVMWGARRKKTKNAVPLGIWQVQNSLLGYEFS